MGNIIKWTVIRLKEVNGDLARIDKKKKRTLLNQTMAMEKQRSTEHPSAKMMMPIC